MRLPDTLSTTWLEPVIKSAHNSGLFDGSFEEQASAAKAAIQHYYVHCFVPAMREFEITLAKTHPELLSISADQALGFFNTLMASAYNNHIHGYTNSTWREEQRHEAVKATKEMLAPWIEKLGGLKPEIDPSTGKPNAVVLWSNYHIGKTASTTHGQPLNELPVGKLFEKLLATETGGVPAVFKKWDVTAPLWSAISSIYASHAEGNVHVFMPDGVNTQSIFWHEELGELRQREALGHVTEITVHTLTKDSRQLFAQLKDTDHSMEATHKQAVESKHWRATDLNSGNYPIASPAGRGKSINASIVIKAAKKWRRLARARVRPSLASVSPACGAGAALTGPVGSARPLPLEQKTGPKKTASSAITRAPRHS